MELQKGPVPKYYQLKEVLSEQISSGMYAIGDKLPGVDDLSSQFGVSRVTAHKALSLLQDAGVVISRRGMGTVVASSEENVHPEPAKELQQQCPTNTEDSASRPLWQDVLGQKTIVHLSSGMSVGRVPEDASGVILRTVQGLEASLGGARENGGIVYLDTAVERQLSWAEIRRLVGRRREIGGFIVQRVVFPGSSNDAFDVMEAQVTRLVSESGLPVVAIDAPTFGDGIASIVVSNDYATRLAVQHLISLGHKRILCVGGGANLWVSQRLDAFRTTMSANGLPVGPENLATFDKNGEDWKELGYQAARLRLSEGQFSAVVAINDAIAQGVIQAAGELGLSVPDQLSVTGIDNQSDLYFLNLTTVHIPWEEVGRNALSLLAEMTLGASHVCSVVLRPRLVVRSSTAPCNE